MVVPTVDGRSYHGILGSGKYHMAHFIIYYSIQVSTGKLCINVVNELTVAATIASARCPLAALTTPAMK